MNIYLGRNDDEIGLMSLLDDLIVLENGERYTINGYIIKLQQGNKQLKEVIEEVKKNLKSERKTALSLNQPYTISVVDRTLQILDKAKGEMNNGK